MKKTALVIFKKTFSEKERNFFKNTAHYEVVIAPAELKDEITLLGYTYLALEEYVEAGSIYTANTLVQELSTLTFHDGTRVSKSFIYKGYELWWMNYDTLYFLYCLPYSQYKRLLEHLVIYDDIHLYNPPYPRLFESFMTAYRKNFKIIKERKIKSPSFLPVGVFCQIMLTFLFLPVLIIQRRPIMVYISDEFHGSKDYHFRMGFIYEALRAKNLSFVEYIRSIESWSTVITHAFRRKRPVVYTDAILFIARFISYATGGRLRAKRLFKNYSTVGGYDSEKQFKLSLATQYLLCVYDDVWAIRIMKVYLRVTGVKSALIVAAMGRNFQTVLACKLNKIPIIGILHGVASQHYNVYDFMPTYDGDKVLSVDKYGVWSEWWKEYYTAHSRVYQKEQLYVSGPMRPLMQNEAVAYSKKLPSGPINVLLVSEQLAVPEEVLPYLKALIEDKGISLSIVFRPKWGDYFDLKEYDTEHTFIAENPEGLIQRVKQSTDVSEETLRDLQNRFFGNPYQNGSAWAIEEIEKTLIK
ncbi:hypothetical protein IPH92_05275 [Candidatus Kaiserbacteria bacterium]|nr:MAG: hypothetical protein IPH92_05275 [Candidatus Kaiserbacteria bacterium]